jgi:hypothetical protein
VYVITDEQGSRFFMEFLDERRARPLARSASVPDNLWFHFPASLSPSKRWLLVAASDGRREAVRSWSEATCLQASFAEAYGELWLVDCSAQIPPRRVLCGVRLLDCSWSPSEAIAACHIGRDSVTGTTLELLDAEAGSLRLIAEAGGTPGFAPDGRSLQVYRDREGRGEILTYDIGSRHFALESETRHLVRRARSKWSPCLDIRVFLTGPDGDAVVAAGDASGTIRMGSLPDDLARIVGWSSGSRLLAYLAGDDALHFHTGNASAAQYERFTAAYAEPGESVARSAAVRSIRDGVSLSTRRSPVTVDTSAPPAFGWATSSQGPCLVYLEGRPGGQSIKVLQFDTTSLRDLGVDPKVDYRIQLAEQAGRYTMQAFASALMGYAREHDGSLPASIQGPELAGDLAPYLDENDWAATSHSGGYSALRLLVPGASVAELRRAVEREPRGQVPVAEMESAEGLTFRVVATTAYGWRPGEFAYDIVVERQ